MSKHTQHSFNKSRSPEWQDIEMQLRAAGEHPVSLQAPGFRFRMPKSIINMSESLFSEPWVASVWSKTQLRLIPLAAWLEYLDYISEKPNSIPREVVEMIDTRAERISKKCPRGRWYIRQNLIDGTDFSSDPNEIVIVANCAWIEIWTPSARQQAIDAAMQFYKD